MGGGKGGGGGEAAAARAEEQARQQKIREGTERVNNIFDGPTGFNDAFYSKRKQSYIDYANPQLEDQRSEAEKQLTFALARSGNLDSSVRGQKAGELQKQYDLNKQKVADDALSYETQARNSVEDARSGLITTLNATGDAEGAANAAISRASALSQPAAYSPIADLFGQFKAGLGVQAAAERANYYGGYQAPRYQTGLFAPSRDAVQNRG